MSDPHICTSTSPATPEKSATADHSQKNQSATGAPDERTASTKPPKRDSHVPRVQCSTPQHRYINAVGIPGPHSIPRTVQVKRPFYRLFSVKADQRIVLAEGRLQADAIIRAEGDPTVTWLCEQAMRVPIPLDNRPYFTFDLALRYRSGKEVLFIIRPDSQLATQADGRRSPANWSVLEGWAKQHGHRCQIITDLDLEPDKQLIANWRILLPFVRQARQEPHSALEKQILIAIATEAVISIADLSTWLPPGNPQVLLAAVASLLHQGSILAELEKHPVSTSTILRGAAHA